MVSVVVVVFGRGATFGGVALGLVVSICCRVVWMDLLFLAKSPVYAVMKVREAAMVRCHGAGCRGTGFVGGTLHPFALDRLALVVVNSSMESITQVKMRSISSWAVFNSLSLGFDSRGWGFGHVIAGAMGCVLRGHGAGGAGGCDRGAGGASG